MQYNHAYIDACTTHNTRATNHYIRERMRASQHVHTCTHAQLIGTHTYIHAFHKCAHAYTYVPARHMCMQTRTYHIHMHISPACINAYMHALHTCMHTPIHIPMLAHMHLIHTSLACISYIQAGHIYT